MKLYFLRHAEAEDGPVDAERRLTAKGRRDARRVGRFLEKSGIRLDAAFTSPLVRARETADEVLKHCRSPHKRRAVVVEALVNGTTAAGFFRWVRSLPDVDAALLVGHEPSLGAWIRRMIGIENPEALPLAKSTLVRVDTEDRKSGTLRLLIGVKQLA